MNWKRILVGEWSWGRLVRSVVEAYLCLLVVAYFFSDRIIFQPPPPSDRMSEDIVYVPVRGGERVAVLSLVHPSADFVLLHSHGNAEDIGGVREIMEEFLALVRAHHE